METPILLPLLLLSLLGLRAHASTYGLRLHHRFSDTVRAWADSLSPDYAAGWPSKGSVEYYSALAAHDLALLHRRGLVGSPQQLTFADGNETSAFSAFGFLHYADVELGTPKVRFLVALDTGSDLLWVPCDCDTCAPTYNKDYNISFNIFKSASSSTSKRVPCSSNLCELQSSCSKPADVCPYKVSYVDNTSTSGVLIEDVLHLITDDTQQKAVDVRVVFGCGQNQPSTFSGVPNGLLGLGLGSTAVPNTLAAQGLTANSFSMCFSSDGSGRIRFGDKGSSNQHTTPFLSNVPIYAVTAREILVGGQPLSVGINAIFDTGSSFTLLDDRVYTEFASTFDSFIQRQRLLIGSKIPFEYCYRIGANEQWVTLPRIELIMNGGKNFSVLNPIFVLADSTTRSPVGFCMAVMRSTKLNIIGQNFMEGYKLVFDRDNRVLGWKEFDCYKDELLPSSPSPEASQNRTTAVMTNSPTVDTQSMSSVPPVLCQSLYLNTVLSLLSLLLFSA